MKKLALNQPDLFGNFPQVEAPQSTLFHLIDDELPKKAPRKQATNRVRRPRKPKIENSLPLFGNGFFENKPTLEPAPAPAKAANDESLLLELKKQRDKLKNELHEIPNTSNNKEKKEKKLAEIKAVNIEILKIEDPAFYEFDQKLIREREQQKAEQEKQRLFTEQPKSKFIKGSWEEARDKREKRYALFNKPTSELEKALENRKKELPQNDKWLWRGDEVCSRYNYELERRKDTETFAAQGFTPTGDDVVAFPNFLISNVISVNRVARKYKGYGMRSPEKNERFFVNEQLHYNECPTPDKLGQKVFESIIYTGFELSFTEVLVFLALIKNTQNLEVEGQNPWGILKCKKRFIIDFLGWNSRSGKYNQKILSTLDVLTQGSWKIEWRTDVNGKINIYHGHLIADYYLSIDDIRAKNGDVPENLSDLKDGEFYYRISPPLIRLFNNYFFKANISAIRAFLNNKGHSSDFQASRASDLKAWFYLYLMSLYEEKTKFISLKVIKEKSGYAGELKELKRLMTPIFADLSRFFAMNDGSFHALWDRKDKYRLNIGSFKKPRLHDVDVGTYPSFLLCGDVQNSKEISKSA